MNHKELYDYCYGIITNSHDKNMTKKKNRLKKAFSFMPNNDDSQQKLHSLVLELKVYDYLKERGVCVMSHDDNFSDPDFECDFGYLECVSITKGQIGSENRRYVDSCLNAEFNRHLSEVPRLSSAIKDKRDKYEQYLNKKKILPDKARLIVLRTSMFRNDFNNDLSIGDLQKILYSIGDKSLIYNTKTRCFEDKDENHAFDSEVYKGENKKLSVDYFFTNEYEIISAVVLVNSGIYEKIDEESFVIFLNPNATNPVNQSLIKKFKHFSLLRRKFDEYQYGFVMPTA